MNLFVWKWGFIKNTRYNLLTTSDDDCVETSADSSYFTVSEGSKCSVRNPRIKVAAALLILSFFSAIFYFAVFRETPFAGEKVGAVDFMRTLNAETAVWLNSESLASWDYDTNLTDSKLQKIIKVKMAHEKWEKEQWNMLNLYDWSNIADPYLKRQFKLYSVLGQSVLPDTKKKQLGKIMGEMEKIYSTTNLQHFKTSSVNKQDKNINNISLEPDLLNIFAANNKTSCELSYYWEGWHGSVGRRERRLFQEYVDLSNEVAKLNNFTDTAAMWIHRYDMEDFESHMNRLYLQILPLYEQLHAYVRNKLSEKYNIREQTVIRRNGPIPAHILGNIWAQEWVNIYNSTMPYPNKGSLDVTSEMIAQNYTVMKMFKLSENFFLSLNLSAMTKTFWEKSVFEKPKDREIVCHGSAWNFYNGEDYRIKMCTIVDYEHLKTVHHEMGHVQYYQQYENQPTIFHDGANPGFHEAVGDTLALSVATVEHLKQIGLLNPKTYVDDDEADINFLYQMALDKVALLSYAYTLERWRWEVFRKNVTSSQYNCRFWELRQELGGIMPPVERSSGDFDPGAKYHIVTDTPYIRYFISSIIQFQFHKALCIKAGKYDPDDPPAKPLHKCDIYQSVDAGNLLRSMLQLGSSKPWEDAMEVLTGQREMDAGPLLEYFHPLLEWLVKENEKTGQSPGWTDAPEVNSYCSKNSHSLPTPISTQNPCRYVLDDNFEHIMEEEEE